MPRDKHSRIKNLETTTPKRKTEQEIRRDILYRLNMTITDELGQVQAPVFITGKGNGGPSYAAQEFGEDYTVGQCYELAVRRAVARLEEVARKPVGISTGDLTAYLEEDDLTPEGREALARVFIEHRKRSRGANWDKTNRHYLRKQERAAEENRRAKEEEWRT